MCLSRHGRAEVTNRVEDVGYRRCAELREGFYPVELQTLLWSRDRPWLAGRTRQLQAVYFGAFLDYYRPWGPSRGDSDHFRNNLRLGHP